MSLRFASHRSFPPVKLILSNHHQLVITSTSLNKQNLCIVSCTFFTSTSNHIVIPSHSTELGSETAVRTWRSPSYVAAPKLEAGFCTQNALKSPYLSILLNPSRPYRSSPLQQTGTSLCCCRTCDGREVALKNYTAWRKSKLSANVAFANARWWHQAEYTSTITLNAILQRHNYSCKNRHGTMHPAVQHVHDTHDLITLQLTMWEFCTCSLALYEQRPTAPRPWSKLFGLFWNGACCSYSLLFYRSC